jgi:gamma-glutamylcyclotransferase (GGCT)/AIG2-like uncharacterized protein YtfP
MSTRSPEKECSMTTTIFCYGTLNDPECQNNILGRVLGAGRPAALPGFTLERLAHLNAYPEEGTAAIGLTYEVPDVDLPRIDFYEGVHSGYYERILVEVIALNGGEVYEAVVWTMTDGGRAQSRAALERDGGRAQ